LNFCRWTEAEKVWIPTSGTLLKDGRRTLGWRDCDGGAAWAANGGPALARLPAGGLDPAALRGRECFAGVDLSSTTDITATVLDFPFPGGLHAWLAYFWIPGDNVEERVLRQRLPYDVWIAKGLLLTTPGNVIDYSFIRAFFKNKIVPQFRLRETALDRLFQSAQMSTDLADDGHNVVAFGQGFLSMAAPCKQLEELVLGGRLNHGGNPILQWMNSNVSIREDPAGNRKPDKQRSREKIDGIVAGLMALGRATANKPQGGLEWLKNPVVVG
jgi:phage terminase large subunit-like protein